MPNIPAIMLLKAASTTKSDLETMAKEAITMTDYYLRKGVVITGVIVTFGNVKDVIKQVHKLVEHNPAQYLLVYNPRQVASSPKAFSEFMVQMEVIYKLEVLCYNP